MIAAQASKRRCDNKQGDFTPKFYFSRPDPGGIPHPPTPPPGSKRAYKLRQQPVENSGSVDCPGYIFVAVNRPLETFGCCCYQVTRKGLLLPLDEDSSTFWINVASSASALELFTRFDTGQRCRESFGAGLRYSAPASPPSHGAN